VHRTTRKNDDKKKKKKKKKKIFAFFVVVLPLSFRPTAPRRLLRATSEANCANEAGAERVKRANIYFEANYFFLFFFFIIEKTFFFPHSLTHYPRPSGNEAEHRVPGDRRAEDH
jgi:hypothetical protein